MLVGGTTDLQTAEQRSLRSSQELQQRMIVSVAGAVFASQVTSKVGQVLEKTGVRDAILVGQSDGASIALAHAGAFPGRVRAVIALSPHLFREERTLAAIREQIADFERGDLKARLRRHHGANTEALFQRLVEVWTAEKTESNLEPYVAKVRCPVLAIQGEDDEFFTAAQLEALERLLPGRVHKLRIPGSRHYPLHQARNEVLAASIRLVRSVTASGTRSPRAAADG
jgi:pimeloyl-ACP methyl ester carboxylesterase